MTTTSIGPWIRTGLMALPLYAVLLAYATRRPQPDQETDPAGWAAFVSSPQYVLEHLLSNVLGASLVILGTVALGALLVNGRSPRLGLTGMVSSVTGQVLFTVPGMVSTFATPAVGASYLQGYHDVMAVEFPPAMTAITALALLLTLVGGLLLAVSIWRSALLPRWSGLIWGAAAVTFHLLGAALGMATTGASLLTQPIGASLMALSSTAIAWTAVRRGRAPHLRSAVAGSTSTAR